MSNQKKIKVQSGRYSNTIERKHMHKILKKNLSSAKISTARKMFIGNNFDPSNVQMWCNKISQIGGKRSCQITKQLKALETLKA